MDDLDLLDYNFIRMHELVCVCRLMEGGYLKVKSVGSEMELLQIS